MKKNIHPEFFDQATITCSCGAVFTVGATQKEMDVEICSQCHPFYTGKKKTLDTTGRVERFKKLTEKSDARKENLKKSRAQKKTTAKKTPAKKK